MSPNLQNLPRRMPPPEMRSALQVIASKERARRMRRQNPGAFLRHFLVRCDLFLSHLIRTTALPAAGGLCAAVLLFMMFVVPVYPLLAHSNTSDVPTMLSTEGSVKAMGALSLGNEDIVVDVAIDEQGRMIDYTVVEGAAILAKADVRRRLENTLLFSAFTPATTFGQPMPSRVRLWFHASEIEVRG